MIEGLGTRFLRAFTTGIPLYLGFQIGLTFGWKAGYEVMKGDVFEGLEV